MADLKVDHNRAASRFEVRGDGSVSLLDYRIKDDTIYLLFVQVPEAEQGRGIASRLSREALNFARGSGLKVVPECLFIAAFMRRHPELL